MCLILEPGDLLFSVLTHTIKEGSTSTWLKPDTLHVLLNPEILEPSQSIPPLSVSISTFFQSREGESPCSSYCRLIILLGGGARCQVHKFFVGHQSSWWVFPHMDYSQILLMGLWTLNWISFSSCRILVWFVVSQSICEFFLNWWFPLFLKICLLTNSR